MVVGLEKFKEAFAEFSDNYVVIGGTACDIVLSGTDIFNRENRRCFDFIQKSVAESTAPHKIVVTHHVPSFQLISPEFKGSRINGAFTVELSDYIKTSGIDYWIYGHSHRNIDKTIGATHCVCNQFGYSFHNEHHTFDRCNFIEI
jgi:hypothetical protein